MILAEGYDVQIMVCSGINADSRGVLSTHLLKCLNINMVYSDPL